MLLFVQVLYVRAYALCQPLMKIHSFWWILVITEDHLQIYTTDIVYSNNQQGPGLWALLVFEFHLLLPVYTLR